MKYKLKNIMPYLVNGLIVTGIFCLILFISQSFPFGQKLTLGKSDAIFQYKPMLYNFIMRLKTGTLYPFTFNNGLGNSFYFNFAYYLTSPINLVALLFKNPDVMYLSVIVVKMFITAIICTFYTRKKGGSNLTSLIVTLSYVFSSWFIVYYYNIMWLDTFMIFPLVQYGLEELISKNKVAIFIFALAYCFYTNFLLAFAVIVYVLVYFIIRNFFYDQKSWKDKFKTLGIFLLAFIWSFLIIAFFFNILVVVKRQMGLGFSNSNDSNYFLSTVNFFKSLFYGNNILNINFSGETFPNIAVNTFILLNIIFYFLNSKIKPRDKAFVFIGLSLVIDCLFSTKMDYVMNFFHNVIGLTYRYVFIFIFLGIILFIKNMQNYDQKDLKKMIPVIGILMLVVILLRKRMEFKIWIINLVFLLLFLMLIFFKEKKYSKYVVLLLVFSQTLIISYLAIPADISFEKINTNFIEEPIKYRLNTIGKNDYLNKNLYTNQDVTYSFTSMTYNKVLAMVKKLGFNSGGNGMHGNIYNDLFSLIFNVKNDLYLEKIYAVNKDITKTILLVDDVKNNTEDLIYKMTGIKDIYREEVLEANRLDDDNYYFDIDKHYYFVKDGDITLLKGLGTAIKKRDNIENNKLIIYTLDENKLKEIYDKLSKNQIKYSYYRDDLIKGTIEVDEGELIFTSIPYDKSWQVKVDGRDVQTVELLDSLLGIEVDEGKHEIILEYKCDFQKGIIISLVSFISLIGYLIFKSFKSLRVAKIK